MDVLDTEGDGRPARARRAVLAAVLVAGVAAAVWLSQADEDGRPGAEDAPSLRLSVDGFLTRASATEVEYTVTNDGRAPVRLQDIAVEDDAARTVAVRVPDDEIGVGRSAKAGVRVRFSCPDAETRPVRPGLRLTAVTRDGRRHVVAPAPGSELALDDGGGSLLTGPATAPCSACVVVLDALAPVDEDTHRADLGAAARAAAAGTRVVVPSVVEQALQTLRVARPQLPADQRSLASAALEALEGIAAGDGSSLEEFEVLDRLRDDLDASCDPAVPEVFR
jgi:hypothetical protein